MNPELIAMPEIMLHSFDGQEQYTMAEFYRGLAHKGLREATFISRLTNNDWLPRLQLDLTQSVIQSNQTEVPNVIFEKIYELKGVVTDIYSESNESFREYVETEYIDLLTRQWFEGVPIDDAGVYLFGSQYEVIEMFIDIMRTFIERTEPGRPEFEPPLIYNPRFSTWEEMYAHQSRLHD
tara:strand:- start:58 stop:597 length:540 start_codon:yes stop_codon:yes gene_type:complete